LTVKPEERIITSYPVNYSRLLKVYGLNVGKEEEK